jgi:hypothetical protein
VTPSWRVLPAIGTLLLLARLRRRALAQTTAAA